MLDVGTTLKPWKLHKSITLPSDPFTDSLRVVKCRATKRSLKGEIVSLFSFLACER